MLFIIWTSWCWISYKDIWFFYQITGEIFLRTELDYEEYHSYDLIVMAEDQGVEQRQSSSMTLTVRVKDINDHAPEFTQNIYNFFVSEDAQIGKMW